MSCPTVVVGGASAGDLQAVRTLVGGLPADFPASVSVVMHRGTGSPTLLRDLLSRTAWLSDLTATNTEPVPPGTVYLAPVDRHILLEDSRAGGSACSQHAVERVRTRAPTGARRIRALVEAVNGGESRGAALPGDVPGRRPARQGTTGIAAAADVRARRARTSRRTKLGAGEGRNR